MYLFYVVTTNILLCIFSFFADVLSYDISHGPCRLQIETPGDGIDIEHLTGKEQTGMCTALKGRGIDIGERHATTGHKLLLEAVLAVHFQDMIREHGGHTHKSAGLQFAPTAVGPELATGDKVAP